MKQDAPILIDNDKIIKLKEWLDDKLNPIDENGNVDLQKCQSNLAYHMGHYHTTINGLVFQSELQLADKQEKYSGAYAAAIENLKRNKKFDVDSSTFKFLVSGDDSVKSLQKDIDKLNAYIKFLRECLNKINRYSYDATSLIKLFELNERLGI